MVSQNFKKTRETNSAVHTVSNIMKNVMGSAAEAEIVILFQNKHEAEPIHSTLHEMGHIQTSTTMQTDTSTTNGIIINTVCQKRSKKMEMLFYWIQHQN